MVKAVAENEYEDCNGRMQREKVPDLGPLITLRLLMVEGALRPK